MKIFLNCVGTDCELFLKNFLNIDPSKRVPIDKIMFDKWLNDGYEGSPLRPYIENGMEDLHDEERFTLMENMG